MALIDKLTAIADAIREKTGGTDPLTLDAMAEAIASIQTGGGGGDSGIISGSFTPAENLLDAEISIGADTNNFLIYATSDVLGNSAKATALFFINRTLPYAYGIPTNNGGTALSAFVSTTAENSKGYFIINNTTISYTGNNIKFSTSIPSGTCLGYFIAGVTYRWYAW